MDLGPATAQMVKADLTMLTGVRITVRQSGGYGHQAEGFLASRSFPHLQAITFIGKVEYTALSAGSHRVGRAAIAALRAYDRARGR